MLAIVFGSSWQSELIRVGDLEADAGGRSCPGQVNQKVMLRVLESVRAGREWAVRVVDNGQAVLDAMRGAVFDLVLMDLHMPVLDGLEVSCPQALPCPAPPATVQQTPRPSVSHPHGGPASS